MQMRYIMVLKHSKFETSSTYNNQVGYIIILSFIDSVKGNKMDKEKVISILKFYKTIDNEIKAYKIETIEFEHQSTSFQEDLLKSIKQKIESLYLIKAKIYNEINKLPYLQRLIILQFYIKDMQWVRISSQINYSERQCKNIRCQALKNLEINFNNNISISSYDYPQKDCPPLPVLDDTINSISKTDVK